MQVKPTARIRTTSCEALKDVSGAIHASHIMTSRDEFEYCRPDDMLTSKLARMRKRNFDVIPMLRGFDLRNGDFREYLTHENMGSKIKQRFKYCKEAATEIQEEDRIPENLSVEEVILRFSLRRNKSKIPFFLADPNDKVTGLVTLADLDKTPVKVYLFTLMSELELSLLEIVSKHFEKFREICSCGYCLQKRRTRENKGLGHSRLEEYYYLYLKELIHMVTRLEGFSENQKRLKDIIARKEHEKISELRNTIVHPRPLVSDKFPVEKLAETISLLNDLISSCKQNPSFMISAP